VCVCVCVHLNRIKNIDITCVINIEGQGKLAKLISLVFHRLRRMRKRKRNNLCV